MCGIYCELHVTASVSSGCGSRDQTSTDSSSCAISDATAGLPHTHEDVLRRRGPDDIQCETATLRSRAVTRVRESDREATLHMVASTLQVLEAHSRGEVADCLGATCQHRTPERACNSFRRVKLHGCGCSTSISAACKRTPSSVLAIRHA